MQRASAMCYRPALLRRLLTTKSSAPFTAAAATAPPIIERARVFADRVAIIGVAGCKTALQSGSDLDRSHRRGPLFRRGRVRFVHRDQEEATEVAEASESAHHFEPSCCRGARAIRRGPASTGGGTGATGAGGAGVGVGVGVAALAPASRLRAFSAPRFFSG